MSRIGIIVAMRAEAACITSQSLPFDQAVTIDDQLIIRICGMGPAAARQAAIDLCDREQVTGLVSFGIAGALDDALKPGDLVLPEMIWSKQQCYPSDKVWRNQLERALPPQINVIHKPLAASDELVSTADDKYALAKRSGGACAVDMESGAIATIAAEKSIPFIVIRAISDPVQFSPPAALMHILHPDGRVKPVALLMHLLKGSLRLGELLRFGVDAQHALKTLRQVVRSTQGVLSR